MIRKMFKPFLLCFLAVIIFLHHSPGFALDAPLEGFLLKGNWVKVIELIKKDDSNANNPVLRLIMGHASLATNLNNESMLLFRSIQDDKDFTLWSEWTASLLYEHPQNHIALYLEADSNARIGKLEEAEEFFTKAIEFKNDFALAYNARGVIRVFTDKWDKALIDFYQATNLAPDLAEAHASFGNYWVLSESADGALESFNKALKINPDLAIAYNGRGAAYFGKGEFEKAERDFTTASQIDTALIITEINIGFATSYASTIIELASLDNNPGASIESTIRLEKVTHQNHQKGMEKEITDQTFWKKIGAFPHLTTKDRQELVQIYGLNTVQKAVSLEMQSIQINIQDNNKKVQELHKSIGSLGLMKKIFSFGETAISIRSAIKDTPKNINNSLNKGWRPFFTKPSVVSTEIDVGSAVTQSMIGSRSNQQALDAVVTAITRAQPGITIVRKGFEIGSDVTNDKLAGAVTNQHRVSSKLFSDAAKYRQFTVALNDLDKYDTPKLSPQIPAQVHGFSMPSNSPLTDVSAMSTMLDKRIKPIGNSTVRRIGIYSQDNLRSNLLASQLHKLGFETRITRHGADPLKEAYRFGAHAMVKIYPPKPLIHRRRDIVPPNPKIPYFSSGGGQPPGGGASIHTLEPQKQPKLINNFWNKFTPMHTKMPGGVSTKEIAKAFVDKGNWPVITTFGIFYKVITLNAAQSDIRAKQE